MLDNIFLHTADSKIKDLFEFTPNILSDERGEFVKTYNEEAFYKAGLKFNIAEQYFSISKKNTIRGMHFQLPPYEHSKLVYCIEGEVLDVVVDLRKGSPTYGKFDCFNLTAVKRNILYIPVGLAHGFSTLSDHATMVYNVSTTYHKEVDAGIHINSFGYDWKIDNPILSERDKSFIPLSDFDSPFIYTL